MNIERIPIIQRVPIQTLPFVHLVGALNLWMPDKVLQKIMPFEAAFYVDKHKGVHQVYPERRYFCYTELKDRGIDPLHLAGRPLPTSMGSVLVFSNNSVELQGDIVEAFPALEDEEEYCDEKYKHWQEALYNGGTMDFPQHNHRHSLHE